MRSKTKKQEKQVQLRVNSALDLESANGDVVKSEIYLGRGTLRFEHRLSVQI